MAVVSQQTSYGVAQINELKASLEKGAVVLWAQMMVGVGRQAERAYAMALLAQSGCRVVVGIMQSEEWQPLLDAARREGMTEKYVWLATNTAEGLLLGDGVLFTSRAKSSPSSVAKEFRDSWRAATTTYDRSVHGPMSEQTKLPLFDPTGKRRPRRPPSNTY